MTQETKSFLRATATLVGMIIGVGFFGVPYAVAQTGAMAGLFYFVLLGAVMVLVHLMYGETVLRTEGKHRFVGFVEKYLGKKWKRLATVTSTLGFWSALTAYIIIGGRFSFFLFGPVFGGNEFSYQLVFFVILAALVYFGIRLVAKMETALTALLLILIVILIAFALPRFDFATLPSFQPAKFFLPYGVILFAISGAPAIPELRDILTGRARSKMKSTIIAGTALAILFTALFTFAAIGLLGSGVSEDAISSLARVLGSWALVVGALMGLLAVATSFLVLGLNLKEQFLYDLHKSKVASFFLAVGIPLLLFLLLTRDFIAIIGFAGAVFTALDSALLAALWVVARKKGERPPEYTVKIGNWIAWVIILIFTLGAVYEVVQAL